MRTTLTTYFLLLVLAAPLFAESPVPQVSQPPAPPPKSSDRKGGQGAAAAMAAAAAAMQGVSCIMMMNEARKMPPGSEKTMMMMMAMQQCAQAAQTAANAAQNKDGKDKASAGDSTQPQQLAAQPFQTPAAEKDQPLAQAQTPSPSSETSPEIASSDPESGPEFKPVSAEATPSPDGSDVSLAKGIPPPETSIPNTIERSKLGYDESGKAGENPTPERQLGGGTTIATARPGEISKGGPDSKQEFAPNNLEPGEGRKGKGGAEAGEGGVGASDGGTGTGGDGNGTNPTGNPLDAMMALLGGGGTAPEGGKGAGITDLAGLAGAGGKKGAADEGAPNIFEYATFRYKKLTYDDNRLTVLKKAKPPASPATALAKPELAHSAGQ